MTTKADVDDFLRQKTFAVVGVSRKKRKFANYVYRNLLQKGYRLFPVNPHLSQFEGQPCYPDLTQLPEPVDGAVLFIPPDQCETVARDASKAGITRLWIQQGSDSKAGLAFCEQNGIRAIYGQCVMMYAEPVVSVHKFHRWLWHVLGIYPK